jgi:lysozyme
MKKWLVLGSVVVIVAIGLAYYFLTPNDIKKEHKKYPVIGIDISEHTGKVDFVKLKAHRFDFVIIKATEGETFIDKSFNENYQGVLKQNIPLGTYHFYRFNKSWELQANNFIKAVNKKHFNLPLIVDVEEWGNPFSVDRKDVIRDLHLFVNYVSSKTKKRVAFYCNQSSYEKFIKGNFKNEIWICSFSPKTANQTYWTFWQYSHKGKYDFASGWVDINTFHGNKQAWIQYLSNTNIKK